MRTFCNSVVSHLKSTLARYCLLTKSEDSTRAHFRIEPTCIIIALPVISLHRTFETVIETSESHFPFKQFSSNWWKFSKLKLSFQTSDLHMKIKRIIITILNISQSYKLFFQDNHKITKTEHFGRQNSNAFLSEQ